MAPSANIPLTHCSERQSTDARGMTGCKKFAEGEEVKKVW
jgi:hypothetical protein